MKSRLLPLLLIAATLSLSSCAWVERNRPALQKSAMIVAQRAGTIAAKVVLSAAVSSYDAEAKMDFLDGLSTGFRSLQVGEVITSSDVQAMVTAWTPDRPHWNELAGSFAAEWDRINPKTAHESAIFAEAFAQGLHMSRRADGKIIVAPRGE